jgi:hypothetical protein
MGEGVGGGFVLVGRGGDGEGRQGDGRTSDDSFSCGVWRAMIWFVCISGLGRYR